MKVPGHFLTRLLCPAVLLFACVAPSTRPGVDAPASMFPAAAGEDPSAALKNETRLRKLHLVRPDLIPYPIAFEVYC